MSLLVIHFKHSSVYLTFPKSLTITDSVDMSLSKLWEMVKDREALHVAVHGVADVRHD